MLRDFKRNAGMPVERWLETLGALLSSLEEGDLAAVRKLHAPIGQLTSYYQHMEGLAEGYEKDPEKLQQQLQIIQGWQNDAHQLERTLSTMA
jgi:hypothetical protein